MHKPISLDSISFSLPHKNCFEHFSTHIQPSSRIAIIGNNGSGKSSLLNIIAKKTIPTDGQIIIPHGITIGYIKQIIDEYPQLSGGQKFNKKLTEVITTKPDVLLLDEPTNHLDYDHRQSLMRILDRYHGTVIIATHDPELIRTCTNIIWHIDNNTITEFHGSYDAYMQTIQQTRTRIEKELTTLKQKKKHTHNQRMQEQKRAAKSISKGKKNVQTKKWTKMTGNAKAMKAEAAQGKKFKAIDEHKQHLIEQLAALKSPEIIIPTFALDANLIKTGAILSIRNADIGYKPDTIILHNLYLSLHAQEHIAVHGKNASGKSTLIKAILNQENIYKTGSWETPAPEFIGYLDQHYANLNNAETVIEQLRSIRPDWNDPQIRNHLNSFLFRKNEIVFQPIYQLSGGEKARLSLCIIAARPPKLLILDEITNNIDLETKEHIIQILNGYQGAMIIISHEQDFLSAIGIDHTYTIKNGHLSLSH